MSDLSIGEYGPNYIKEVPDTFLTILNAPTSLLQCTDTLLAKSEQYQGDISIKRQKTCTCLHPETVIEITSSFPIYSNSVPPSDVAPVCFCPNEFGQTNKLDCNLCALILIVPLCKRLESALAPTIRFSTELSILPVISNVNIELCEFIDGITIDPPLCIRLWHLFVLI